MHTFLRGKAISKFLTTQEIRFLLTHHDTITGADGEDEISEDDDEHEHQITHFQNPAPSWLHYEHWSLLNTLSNTSEYFKDLSMHIVENVEDWERFHAISNVTTAKVPGYPDLNMWQKLLVLKCIRPDSLIDQGTEIIRENVGSAFLSQRSLI